MAFAGFEIVVKSVMNVESISPEIIQKLVDRLEVESMEIISPPNPKQRVTKQWLSDDVGSEKVLDFLGVVRGDRKSIEKWLLSQEPIEDWVELVLLSKALRNMSAHACLSATKCEELGFVDAIEQIPNQLNKLTDAIFRKLADG